LYSATLNKLNIGNSLSDFMSCNKMPSATTTRRASLGLMSVQNVSKGNQIQTRARSRNSRSSIKAFVKDAISHIKPSLETRKKKIAGITRHVPTIVSPSRGEGLAIRWVLAAAKEKQRKGGKELAKCLSNELLDAYLKRGEVRQRRDLLHKLAESNRSYVRYRWW
jgi:ribosomal protein S7